MTANKKKKLAVRARMATTGESYQAAHRALTGEVKPEAPLVLEYLAHVLPFDGRKLTVGRNMSCDLVIDDGLASRRHATFWVEAGRAWVEDHDSRNGVLVGGKRVAKRQALEPGDVAVIGKAELRIARRGADGKIEPAARAKPTASVVAPAPPAVGTLLAGRYRLKRIVDGGTPASPSASPCFRYDAENELLGGAASISLLPRGALALRPWLKAWLLYEARALRRAAHPRVLEVFDATETDDGTMVLACARAPETTLERWLETHALSGVQVLDVARQLAELLEHLHAKGVFHGALHAGALHVEESDGAPRLKLCSLWCARIADERRPASEDGIVPADVRGDLRAFGVLVSAMLAQSISPAPALDALCRDLATEHPPARCRDAAAVHAVLRDQCGTEVQGMFALACAVTAT